MKVYIERSGTLRNRKTQLFISFQKPFKTVFNATISRRLKSVLEETGDTSVFKGDSKTTTSSPSAMRDNVNIDDIFKTAGRTNNRTFEKFYNRTIMMD